MGDVELALALTRANPPENVIEEVERRADVPWALREALVDALVRKGEAARAMLALRDAGDGLPARVRRAETAQRPSVTQRARTRLRAPRSLRPTSPLGAARAPSRAPPPSLRALRGTRATTSARVARARVARGGQGGRGRSARRLATRRLPRRRPHFGRCASQTPPIRSRAHACTQRAASSSTLPAAPTPRSPTTHALSISPNAPAPLRTKPPTSSAKPLPRPTPATSRARSTPRRAPRFFSNTPRPPARSIEDAWLVRAAALATIGDAHGADEAAGDVIAREATDARTRAYARWARVETRPFGDALARDDARAALSTFSNDGDDAIRAAARALLWSPDSITDARALEIDRASTESSPSATWDWLGARAAACVLDLPHAVRAHETLRHLLAIAQVPAPLASRGPALAFGRDLAMKLGEGEAARRLETLRRAAAEKLRATTPDALKDTLANLVWTRDSNRIDALQESAFSVRTMRAAPGAIIRSLGGAQSPSRPLLLQVLDAMVLWVGVERGLLLLRAPNGKLAARAARNLAREDLHGI